MEEGSIRSMVGSPGALSKYSAADIPTLVERKNISLRSSTITSITGANAGHTGGSTAGNARSHAGINSNLRLLDFQQLSRSRLKQVRSISGLMAGFALEGLVQINIVSDMHTPLLTAYGVVTAMLIGVNLFALMIATCLLPTLESTPITDAEDEEKAVSIESKFRKYIYMSWILSTGLGIFLFVVDMALIGWIQFYKFNPAAIGVTVVAVPTLFIVAIFGFRFYNMLIAIQLEAHKRALDRALGTDTSVIHV
eukprot:Opistho-2@70975